MMETGSGSALLCDLKGHITRILYDGLDIFSSGLAGKPLGSILTTKSGKKFRQVLKTIVDKGACFGAVIECNNFEQCMGLNISGTLVEDSVLLIVVKARPESGFDRLYDQLTILNNELINAKRELAKKNVELDALASVDALTGISNRRVIIAQASENFRLARRYGITFSLIMADLDRFKLINDTYGHLTGDKVLSQTGSIISRSLRDTDHAGRYGGEEFLVILASTSADEAGRVAERIRQSVAETRFSNETGRTFQVTISLGVATYKGDIDIEAAIDRADKALYRAKQKGRNRVEA